MGLHLSLVESLLFWSSPLSEILIDSGLMHVLEKGREMFLYTLGSRVINDELYQTAFEVFPAFCSPTLCHHSVYVCYSTCTANARYSGAISQEKRLLLY